MGAVTFSLDVRLVEQLKKALPLSDLIETGTFKGETVASMLPYFNHVTTIEISEVLWREASARFFGEPKVEVVHGCSSKVLRELCKAQPHISTLYWLDAHWCFADNTSGEDSQCPLLQELNAIERLNTESVILIDDARLFLATPPAPHNITHWPTFDEIVSALRTLSQQHELMVVNDVIVFSPRTAHSVMIDYARKYGVDWLRACQSLDENASLRRSLEEKESVICQLTHQIAQSGTQNLEEELLQHINQLKKYSEDVLQRYINQLEKYSEDMSRRHISQLEKCSAATLRQQAERPIKPQAQDEILQLQLKQLAERSSENERLSQKIKRLEEALLEKEAVITHQANAIEAYRLAYGYLPVFRPLARLIVRSKEIFKPRLGNLNQYNPRALSCPRAFEGSLSQTPKISIVTPSFCQGNYIENTLQSVLNQGYPNLEYFVQDGGSTDNTLDILKSYQEGLSGWISKKDNGQSHAINLGFARSTGEIMAWLNSDDLLLPGALACVADYFNRHPKVDVVYGNRLLIDKNNMEIGRWILPGHDSNILSWVDYIPQETLFWRRRIWDKVGGQIDESFRFAMDWDLLVRFRDAGAQFAHIPSFLGAFRIHEHQKTSAAINEVGFKEMDRIRERVYGYVPSREDIHKAIAPYIFKHIAVDILYRIKTRLGGLI